MEYFKVYLPSNASHLLYPNNTPTNYKTRFNHPIDLDGEWEVGVESIFYASHVGLNQIKAQIQCNGEMLQGKVIDKNINGHDFILDSDNKWKGLKGVLPTKFEKEPLATENVLEALNEVNLQIVTGITNAFTFTKEGFTLGPGLRGLYVKLTPTMARVLGYGYTTVFNENVTASKTVKKISYKFAHYDYDVRYFFPEVQRKLERIVIKAKKHSFKGDPDTLLTLLNEKMKSLKNDFTLSTRSGRIIIDHWKTNYALIFSPNLAQVIAHEKPVFGIGTTWGTRKVNTKVGKESEDWYIDVYSADMKLVDGKGKTPFHFTVDLFPYRYTTTKELLDATNNIVKTKLMKELKEKYISSEHKFSLKLDSNSYCKLTLGKHLQTCFSKNLQHLLALPETCLKQNQSVRPLGKELNRQQRLFLLSNIARPTAYGEERLQILRSFLHSDEKASMMEKRFDPIVYLPLMTNFIDTVELQLTNEDYFPIKIDDNKTLVCLYFRKVREKTMM